MARKTNKARLDIFKLLRKSVESQGYSLRIKLAENFALYRN